MKFKIIICLVGALVFTGTAMAQENCSQRLADAQARFDVGNLVGIPETLEGCIDSNGFTPEERIRAHKLITQVYLYQDDQEKADEWMIRLLKVDKEHQLDSLNDPQELFFHREKFRYKPIFRVKFFGAMSLSVPQLLSDYGPENTVDGATVSYSSNVSAGGGAEIEKDIYRGISVAAAAQVASRNFTQINAMSANAADTSIQQNNPTTITESQLWAELPVSIKYAYYSQSEWTPFVMAGVAPAFLLSASTVGSRQPEGAAAVERTFPDVIEEGLRNRIHLFYFGGVGVKRKMKTNFLVFDARYVRGGTNLSSREKYGADQDMYFRLAHVDDNFTINSFMFTLGFQLSIYNPEKINP